MKGVKAGKARGTAAGALASFELPSAAMPDRPQRPQPSLYLDLDDFAQGDALTVGDTGRLTADFKVTALREEEHGEDKAVHTEITLRLSSVARTEG